MQEYIITLYDTKHLQEFYSDMETAGGSLYIPDRAVDLIERRPISRNTNYLLTQEEANIIKQDSRVRSVEKKERLDNIVIKNKGFKLDNEYFSKQPLETTTVDGIKYHDSINWGLIRHVTSSQFLRPFGGSTVEWSDGAAINPLTSSLTLTSTGKNVDLIVVEQDDILDHIEFNQNYDGTGTSRINRFNWHSLNDTVGYSDSGNGGVYDYGTAPGYTDVHQRHATNVASVAAGNSTGWARDANILSIATLKIPHSRIFEFINAFHLNKTLNSETGRRNPTVVNMSLGIFENLDDPTKITFQGTTFNPGRSLTSQELLDRGFSDRDTSRFDVDNNSNRRIIIPFLSDSNSSDIEDCIENGIIFVSAAGNDNFVIDKEGGANYDNSIFGDITSYPYSGSLFYQRGDYFAQGGSILIGSVSTLGNEKKSDFSEKGPRLNLFAAGESILVAATSSLTNTNNYLADRRQYDSATFAGVEFKNGTSYSSPQVAGIAACIKENWPDTSQNEFLHYITSCSLADQMYDSGSTNFSNLDSLNGAPNKMLYWKEIRNQNGYTFPRSNFKNRSTTGILYPRPRAKRRG